MKFINSTLSVPEVKEYVLTYLSCLLMNYNCIMPYPIFVGKTLIKNTLFLKLINSVIPEGDWLYTADSFNKKEINVGKILLRNTTDFMTVESAIRSGIYRKPLIIYNLFNNSKSFDSLIMKYTMKDHFKMIYFSEKNNRDIETEEKIYKYCKNDFFLLLLEYYNKLQKKEEPIDKYKIFLDKHTEKSDKHITNSMLYNAYLKWLADNYPNDVKPTHKVFVGGIKKYVFSCTVRINKKVYKGLKHTKLKNI